MPLPNGCERRVEDLYIYQGAMTGCPDPEDADPEGV